MVAARSILTGRGERRSNQKRRKRRRRKRRKRWSRRRRRRREAEMSHFATIYFCSLTSRYIEQKLQPKKLES